MVNKNIMLGNLINQEIKKVGGCIAMAAIITVENYEYFSTTEIKYFLDRHKWNETRRKKYIPKPKTDLWTKEDTEYLLENYGFKKTSYLAEVLNRSTSAVRLKFYAVATLEQKIIANQQEQRWRKSTAFKLTLS